MYELDDEEAAVVGLVRDWVNREVKPVVQAPDHSKTCPEKLIGQMKQLGLFGLAVPEPWGGGQVIARRLIKRNPVAR